MAPVNRCNTGDTYYNDAVNIVAYVEITVTKMKPTFVKNGFSNVKSQRIGFGYMIHGITFA